MSKARNQNQSPSRLCSAVALVSDAVNSEKRKEMLSCSAVILHNKFDATFDSWKIQIVLRAGSQVSRSWSLHFPLPSQGRATFPRVSQPRERQSHTPGILHWRTRNAGEEKENHGIERRDGLPGNFVLFLH